MTEIIAIIPARGGSKGIPRKNLRLLGGKPLIHYSIKNALKSSYNITIFVSSEDDEILSTAMKLGAKIHKRDFKIAQDETTLDPVIYECYMYAKRVEKKDYDLIITLQPTSPLLNYESLDKAIKIIIENKKIDTIIAAKDNTHLSWRKEKNKYVPNYSKRINRQYLQPQYTETGAFLITRNNIIEPNNRIGKNCDLYLLGGKEKIDVDTYEDWNLCEYYLNKKHILFVVTGNNVVGLGHVYNTLLIANDILNHKITFLVDFESDLAFSVINSKNYPVVRQKSNDILDDIYEINPDIIINDRLDTEKRYVKSLKLKNYTVINFEDLGAGSHHADIVVNAIYPEKNKVAGHYYGKDYFILRDEFILSKEKKITKSVNKILITFGGVDPKNYTKKVLQCIYSYCINNNIDITIITGYGYENFDSLKEYKMAKIKKNVQNISDYMLSADLIFTSAGRTIYEIASINTPAIVLEQNERESTHFFASEKYGFLNLGLGYKLKDHRLFDEFQKTLHSFEKRKEMSNLMKNQDLKSGRSRVNKLIQKLIQNQ